MFGLEIENASTRESISGETVDQASGLTPEQPKTAIPLAKKSANLFQPTFLPEGVREKLSRASEARKAD